MRLIGFNGGVLSADERKAIAERLEASKKLNIRTGSVVRDDKEDLLKDIQDEGSTREAPPSSRRTSVKTTHNPAESLATARANQAAAKAEAKVDLYRQQQALYEAG